MRTTLLLPLAALAACAVAADKDVETSAAEAAALSDAIADRSAGRPTSCVRQQDLHGSRSVGDRLILFEGPGNTVYVNRTRSSCPRIQPWHSLRRNATQPAMCAGDLIHVFESTSGVDHGACSLGEFTPYRRRG